ncbi:hypothetical protein MNV49_007149 [Pseudohyphozyma bogoriensis]|nr:hypothetical protein MNV49_007149 [Pseudohyphozyma bogoriensis]
MISFGSFVSAALGWTYTAAWSLSFYGQLLVNYRRKAVSGLSIDFLYLNPLGFSCYTAFNAVLLFSPVVREEYRSRHNGNDPSVRWNDFAFALHADTATLAAHKTALIISSFTVFQSLIYKRDPNQRSSNFNRAFISLAFVVIFGGTILASSNSRMSWLDLIYVLSYIKLWISFAKYVPQAYLNWQRKSTIGWSIENILLDLTGGTLSLAQLVLDSWRANDWAAITGNPGKLGLSLLSIAFDIVFVVQHYVLYRDSHLSLLDAQAEDGDDEAGPEGERQRLLSSA